MRVIACFLLLLIPAISFSQTGTLVLKPAEAQSKDIFIHSVFPAGIPGLNGQEIVVAAWTYIGTPGTTRGLIEFDLTQLPVGATILGARLKLYGINNPNSNGQHSSLSGPNDSYLRRIIQPWNEGTVSWNNQPPTTTVNEVYIPLTPNVAMDYDIDVTAMVQDMQADPANSHGFMMSLNTEQYYRRLVFASSGHPDSAKHPELVIEYRVTQEKPCLDCTVDNALNKDLVLCLPFDGRNNFQDQTGNFV